MLRWPGESWRIRDKSELLRKPSQFGRSGDESQSGKDGEIVLNRDGRRHQPSSYLADGVAERAWHQVKVINQKIVGVQHFEAVGRDRALWKISKVARDDHVAASDYRRGKNMTVVGIRKVERGDKCFVSGNEAIPRRPIHPIAGALEGCSITVRFVAEQSLDPFPMDVSGPLRAEKVVNRQLQKNIPHRCGIENVGVKKGSEARHRAAYPMS